MAYGIGNFFTTYWFFSVDTHKTLRTKTMLSSYVAILSQYRQTNNNVHFFRDSVSPRNTKRKKPKIVEYLSYKPSAAISGHVTSDLLLVSIDDYRVDAS